MQVNSFEEEKGFSAVLIRDNEFISKQPCIPDLYFPVSPVPKKVYSRAHKSSFVATQRLQNINRFLAVAVLKVKCT